ncbi:MAG: hypothetical protein ACNYVW_05230 [Methanosarcinales archaeon]
MKEQIYEIRLGKSDFAEAVNELNTILEGLERFNVWQSLLSPQSYKRYVTEAETLLQTYGGLLRERAMIELMKDD